MSNGKLVKIESAANLVQDLRNKSNTFGFSPKQARAALGRLTRGQSEAFKAALVAWVNEAEVNDDHRGVVEAQRGHIEAQGRKPWNEDLNEGPALLNENDKLRVSFCQAVAWAHAVQLDTDGKADIKAVLDARDGTTVRGLLRKLGLTAQAIGSRFPELQAGRTRTRSGALALPEETANEPVSLGGSRSAGRQISAARAVPQGFTAKQLIAACSAAGLDAAETLALVAEEPKTVKAVIAALADAEPAVALAVVAELA